MARCPPSMASLVCVSYASSCLRSNVVVVVEWAREYRYSATSAGCLIAEYQRGVHHDAETMQMAEFSPLYFVRHTGRSPPTDPLSASASRGDVHGLCPGHHHAYAD